MAIAPKSNPASNANGGEAQGVRQKIIPQKNSSFEFIQANRVYFRILPVDTSVWSNEYPISRVIKMGPMPRSGDDFLGSEPIRS